MMKIVLQRYLSLTLLVLLLAAHLAFPTYAAESTLSALRDYLDNGGFAVEKDGRVIAAENPHEMFVPASIIKVAASLAALHSLGPDYRFETHIFIDPEQNLYIKGFGDPFLISEEVAVIAGRLKELGCERINNIYLDDTAFATTAAADGSGTSDNPYDAQNSALAVNFNTINIEKDRTGTVRSAEEQTPTLALMAELSRDLVPGVHRINISWDSRDGIEAIRRYTGELFRAFLQQENIAGSGVIAFRSVPVSLAPFYIHRSSRTLEDILGPFMLYSNNFIANQLFLAMGAAEYGHPATWEKSRQAMETFLLKKFNLTSAEIRVVEGSGLSRKNRVTPNAMIRLLDAFKPYGRYLPEEDGRFVKSGTLKGVYAYAGYFTEGDTIDSFVLILNQQRNNRDRILLLLEEIYHGQ
ncbi:MAG: D-alanyl-D-alanine carboxypeptidase [Deltaproteobacteria bacterium]|jgi:D-alanyl-D-alanine carboxypeptidase/D-alanyl-D-alanine-endopeptidase (penicillin-binding protein 4)|nr:D-alanyl-D-alanine carboxypeptidase [Deltaproteobacteria bacterium]